MLETVRKGCKGCVNKHGGRGSACIVGLVYERGVRFQRADSILSASIYRVEELAWIRARKLNPARLRFPSKRMDSRFAIIPLYLNDTVQMLSRCYRGIFLISTLNAMKVREKKGKLAKRNFYFSLITMLQNIDYVVGSRSETSVPPPFGRFYPCATCPRQGLISAGVLPFDLLIYEREELVEDSLRTRGSFKQPEARTMRI